MSQELPPVGPSGAIARAFQNNHLTPLLALLAIILGVLAVVITPKEEEPQIDVTMADIMVALPGASTREVESVIATPAEQVMSEIKGVEHVYSVSRQGQAVITVQFEVGIERQEALVRLYNQVYSNQDWLPPGLGASQPLIKPRSIDDVPVMTLTLYDPTGTHAGEELTRLAHMLEVALKRVPGTRDIYTVGGIPDRVDVVFNPALLSGFGLTTADIANALNAANASSQESRVTQGNVSIPVQAGTLLESVADVKRLVVGMHNGAAVHLDDVAQVRRGGTVPDQSLQVGFGPAHPEAVGGEPGDVYPAVTLAIAKKPGENAINITTSIEERLDQLRNRALPPDVEVLVTRDYGLTASDKAQKLISDLISATLAVMVLVLAFMGWRQAVIVGVSVLITLLLTLVFSWAWGFTLNRVSLFALIFSIGILVDDGIVITENINRRIQNTRRSVKEIIPVAVDEVGTPTIMASLTIMAALLPMAFVTGLMGPYMSPIPINASAGMVMSQIVAFVVAPWLALRLLRHKKGDAIEENAEATSSADGVNPRALALFNGVLTPFLGEHPWRRRFLGLGVVLLTLAAASLPVFLAVILKMLPFDNKSELQVVVDMPERTPVEQTQRVLTEMGHHLETVGEVSDWQAYAGTASPINFNGLVRQYYLRSEPYQGDIQVNPASEEHRERASHTIAQALREPLTAIGKKYGAEVKIVEVPPGPPVLSPIVAEVYAVNAERRADMAKLVARELARAQGVVQVDTTLEAPTREWEVVVDRDRAARLGVSQAQVVTTLQAALNGTGVSFLHDDQAKYPVPIRVILGEGDKAQPSALLSIKVRSRSGQLVPLASIAEVQEADWMGAIYHKDLLPVTYVTADMAGEIDSPLYGMFRTVDRLKQQAEAPEQYFIEQPVLPEKGTLKWDGEWQITYETFRDMGIAYSVGVFMIFVLLVAQFRSYILPLVIMAPIPLTLIGIMPGHALLGKEFTATSMIGMIALAGIIVRNSILLVVFIKQLLDEGMELDRAVVLAGAVRIKPIALTAISAIVGAYFILSDPIFNGLAISLIFGLLMSTLLTVIVVPLLYYTLARCRWL
ncbi:efflux RND transporter permease subunit [Marinobacter persicus]|uniref:Multidrug efflux pump subunit AcrB n=1 Tax=Marinobacter persicus TaxID=930118 RepID=A0A2S6G9V2_9GAMM|nr:efflux RND transporter permease subunit [Marinobacter persicus]PPK53240.1 multidrug efflux pump subunit AcrB [Marinobacter persicus]PPK56077.1 multidrug efflux pump subunit AcrB [Marinobacter persicus]PPK59672.1 multidrug efflux pump subunit AcrB [Marinobacter persicus]